VTRLRASRRAQRGVALLGLLAVAVMVFAYVLTSRLNAASMFVGIDRQHNAKVMSRAKQALVGWMAMNAAGTDDNPGRLPCPEAPGFFGDPAQEGIAAGSCVPPNNVGRLPWRTLGMDRPVDAGGEPLWYAVSPGWSLPGASTTPINSDAAGQLPFNGENVVALIFAPGVAQSVQVGGSCSARAQVRPAAGPPDVRDYLECGNETGAFVASAAGQTFNDQVQAVRTADVVPALEAAIQQRMQREIAPSLRTVYGAANWGTSPGNPIFPFATPFGDPGTSNFRGVDGQYQGLLPFTSSAAGCGADPRCTSTFVDWDTSPGPSVSISGGGGLILSSSCGFPNATTVRCTGVYTAVSPATLRMTVRADNVAMALRTLAPSNITVEYGLLAYGPPAPGSSASGDFNSDGSADLTLRASVPGLVNGLGIALSVLFRITADLGVLADHALLDPTTTGPGATGWFVRNEWYRHTYYAAAQRNTADGLSLGFGCTASINCLRFNNTRNIHALLVLTGRALQTQSRPSSSPQDFGEYQNSDLGTIYEQRPIRQSRFAIPSINAPFNDRVVLVDWVAPAPTFPLSSLP
jgi:hypothetical protein